MSDFFSYVKEGSEKKWFISEREKSLYTLYMIRVWAFLRVVAEKEMEYCMMGKHQYSTEVF